MGQPCLDNPQARFRAEMRRSGAIRNGMILAQLAQLQAALLDAMTAWLRRSAASKQAPQRPRSSAG